MTTRAVVLVSCVVATGGCVDGPELGTASSELDVSAFVLPSLPDAERAQIVHAYDRLDPSDEVPRGMLEDAIIYFDLNIPLIPKTKYFAIADFSRHSGMDRYWLVDTTTGAVEAHKVAHGDGSDPDNNGTATLFGNVDGSHRTSLGFYLSGEIYDGTHAHSMRLDGLSVDGSPNGMANTNARDRLIVMHEASYVADDNITQQGRSNGCLALDPAIEVSMVDRIHDGTLIYAAISSLNPPVGRCTGSNPSVEDPDEEPDESGGCSTSGGSPGLLLGLAFVLTRRKRR
ncbi:hypothetical protein BH11MYX3_BH11MYX3_11870 [soil metagenome]